MAAAGGDVRVAFGPSVISSLKSHSMKSDVLTLNVKLSRDRGLSHYINYAFRFTFDRDFKASILIGLISRARNLLSIY